jgi:diguanylate cyclase (GGDEF)-like protein
MRQERLIQVPSEQQGSMKTAISFKHFFKFLAEPEALLKKKLHDHRHLSVAMFLMTALLGSGEWVWDHITDPIGALHTIGLRSLFLLLLTYPFIFKYIRSRRVIEFIAVSSGLIATVILVEIMNRLHNGMANSLPVFMYMLFLPLVMFQSFSLRVNLLSTFIYAATPQILGLVGFAKDFPYDQYNAIIWPATIVLMLSHYIFANNYRIRYKLQMALELASNTDSMTGVSNRRHFMPTLQQEMLRGLRFNHPSSLMILDIDHFKAINDTHGHPTGDLVIRAVADICTTVARKLDVVARIGGEEFAVLVIDATLPNALGVAERIRSTIAETRITSLAGKSFSFTVSIGVAEQPLDDVSEERLIHLADTALYQAKSAGRNCVVGSAPPMRTMDALLTELEDAQLE